MRPWLALGLILGILWTIHLAATWRNGFALPDATRANVGASAQTVWSRFHAHFVAPFFHDGLFHIAYNSVLFALALPVAWRAFGWPALPLAYLASPIAGILVDALLILPLAARGVPMAVEAAPDRLVGASVIAFALVGMALVALAPRMGQWVFAAVAAVVLYEAILALTGTTRPFVWAYHLGGFGIGLLAALVLARWPLSSA